MGRCGRRSRARCEDKGIFAREVEAAPKRENERYGLQCYVYAGDQSSDTVCFS